MTPSAKVTLLSLHYPPEPTGNAPYAGSLAVGLAKLGHTVQAHVGHPHYPGWEVWDGYGQWTARESTDGVDLVRRRHYIPDPPRGVRRLISEFSFGLRLLTARIPRDSTVIALSPSMFATAVAALRLFLTPNRPPVIVWVQDIYTLGLAETGQGSHLAARIVRQVEAWTLRTADRVVAIHPRFADYLVDQLGVDREQVRVVRNWTHLTPRSATSKRAARAALGWDENARIVLHAGNMGAKQGLENVVEAARLAVERDEDITFILVGDGNQRRALVEAAADVERLNFVPPLDEDEFRFALAAADVLLVNEKVGVSAMAVPSKLTSYFDAGRPVVAATDVDGITASEVHLADAGVVVPAGSPSALLDTLVALLSNNGELSRLGDNARAFRERAFNADEAIDEWSRMIVELQDAANSRRRKGSRR
ncbi:glycosyltransferase family 4 protein [Sphingomonas sp. BLCC-B65]|jgi:colanic acid biosynthesis glycosyl transferase WcaI|nr:glycosyltransferase family 4 protein [Sphingomonas sp. BLCC-B65]